MAGKAKRTRKIRVGVFGAGRGRTMMRVLAEHPDARLVAVCDKSEVMLEGCREAARGSGAKVTYYTDAEKFFEHDFDAVVLANYANEHGPWAVRALRSGRHVLSEVLAVQTLNEALELAEAVEESGKVYAYAENYCYFRATYEMKMLYRRGDLGEFLHGEGEYIHNCRGIWPQIAYGEKGHWRNRMYSTFYCTHSMGPMITITGTRPVRVVGFETPNTGWDMGYLGGTSGMEVCQMSNGATVKSVHGNLTREPASLWCAVYGTKGMAEADRWDRGSERVNVYREGDSGTPYERSYVPSFPFETELSRRTAGHGGSDFYTVHFWLEKILGRPSGKESIDVYEALDMTVVGILAYKSILDGNGPQEVPDFRRKREREVCRGDNFCVDKRVAGDQAAPSCSRPVREIPKSVYAEQKAKWREYLKANRRK